MTGKRKNSDDNWMPPRVYRGRSAYEFKHHNGSVIRLCSLDCTQSVVWAEYEKYIEQQKDNDTFKKLVGRFLISAEFTDLAFETQKDYHKYARKLTPVFGDVQPNDIRPEHVRRYMDKRELKSKTQENREKTFMSRVFGWGYERGYVKGNPCKGVRQYREKSRERYITDAEYAAVFAAAPDMVRAVMELAYLCCARQSDVFALTRNQILEDGIYICQGKTGAKQIKAWSDRLRAAVALADSVPISTGIASAYVIHQQNGNRYMRDGFNSRWRNAKLAAKAANPAMNIDFTFHDLKAKGISDLEGSLIEKQAISGHKNSSQTAIYDRRVKIVPVVGNQKK
ncbi:MAG: tyrosine-type recombinase/integrase [Serratia symbiotica]|nr:tyrosine-type recombinase/integrase [Serratia symbiotica]